MKTWTVVLEITDGNHEPFITTPVEIENVVSARLNNTMPPAMGYRIMECIEAPYGPQHPGGVYVVDVGGVVPRRKL